MPTRTDPPTAPPKVSTKALRRSRAGRRLGVALLVALVAAGAIGLFGIRTRNVAVSGRGYSMSLRYPFTERSNQPITWVLTIRHPGGFAQDVDVAIEHSYLDLLDLNDIQPSPSDSTTDGAFVVWTFSKPPGDVLRVTIDALIQANAHFGAGAIVQLMQGGAPILSLSYRTWVAP